MADDVVRKEAERELDAPFVDLGPSEAFSEAVSNLLMAAEEWRRSLTKMASVEEVVEWQQSMEQLLQILDDIERWTDDSAAGDTSLQADLLQSCQVKTLTVANETLELLRKLPEPTHQEVSDPNVLEAICKDWQGSIARMTELSIIVSHRHRLRFPKAPALLEVGDLVQSYVDFQRETLRRRVTPAVAHLKQARVSGTIGASMIPDAAVASLESDNLPAIIQHHAPVLATILGQALALQHPLVTWYVHLEGAGESSGDEVLQAIRKLCKESVTILDSQAQAIVETIVTWFGEDQPIDSWIQKLTDENVILDRAELGRLDALVEEMAFGSQVCARYSEFVKSAQLGLMETIPTQILPELTWKYAMLERSLATTQWSYALSIAAPVCIVLGTSIQVPSVLEDAQYLSTRALERAATTSSLQAIGTVAHAVAHDVWSEDTNTGVYQALAQQQGCWGGEEPDEKDSEKEENDGNQDFASALLGALDEDLKAQPASLQKPPSAPTSASFLTTLAMGGNEKVEQMRLESLFCVLNGTHAASAACRSLVGILESLLEEEPSTADAKSAAMIQLAKEELCRYAQTYEKQLVSKIEESVTMWCGSTGLSEGHSRKKFLEALQLFFLNEEYEVDADSIQALESDERLETEMLGSLMSSAFIGELANRCEPDVLAKIGVCVADKVVTSVLQSLNGKKVTDWGAILLAKETQTLLEKVSRAVAAAPIEGALPAPPSPELIGTWERLSQTVTVLQLEKPGDWIPYSSSSILKGDELHRIMSMRVEFRPDAIQQVVDSL